VNPIEAAEYRKLQTRFQASKKKDEEKVEAATKSGSSSLKYRIAVSDIEKAIREDKSLNAGLVDVKLRIGLRQPVTPFLFEDEEN
jgi:hypothetical protein